MRPFKHIDAKTIDQAVNSLEASDGTAKVMSGGTDLLGAIKNEIYVTHPQTIINLKTIPNLRFIQKESGSLKVGALTRLSDIADSPLVKENWGILAEAAHSIASPQIRNMATIGGNLCQDVRCWFYRASPFVGERYECLRKGGSRCYALTMENQYHSIFGAAKSGPTGCSSHCPGGVGVPAYLSKVREGDMCGAAIILLESNPLPAITGRVCPHFCEEGCVRNDFDEPVSIRAIERFVGDYILDHADVLVRPVRDNTGKRVAVVGSGPAGLAAAYYLMKMGHKVTVFDKLEEAGGMLSHGIPEFILRKKTVQMAVSALEQAGVEFRLGVEIGRDILVGKLQKGFDSVFIATGAWGERKIGIEGEGLTESALSFLAEVKRGTRKTVGKKVLVVGGGNVAVDVAITARRLGAQDVTMICLECSEEMPALPWEIEQVLEEGVKLMPSWGPAKVIQTNGKTTGLELVRCTSVFGEKGCFAPTFERTEKMRIEGDQVIMAVGQARDLSLFKEAWAVETSNGFVHIDKESQATNLLGLFAGGDLTSSEGTVIAALAAGRRAAVAMDAYLTGKRGGASIPPASGDNGFLKFSRDCLERKNRAALALYPLSERTVAQEDSQGLRPNQVDDEAKRCFDCGCLAVAPSDIATVLMALDGKVVVEGTKGSRTLPIEKFLIPLGNALEPGEIVTEIRIPIPDKNSKQAFLKFRLRNALDFAMVSVAANITHSDGKCKAARVILGSVAPSPLRVLGAEKVIIGNAIDDAGAERAAMAAAIDSVPLARNGYKVDLVKALVKKAILSCKGG